MLEPYRILTQDEAQIQAAIQEILYGVPAENTASGTGTPDGASAEAAGDAANATAANGAVPADGTQTAPAAQ